MPSAIEGPTVALSFANNFWGKDDAGVGPLLDRMASAKQTSDELRSFYGARASIEDDYARKLMSLCRKSLGSHEMGSLKTSLDTVRGEVESMAKQHAGIAAQMKTELEEPLAAFAGGMKERRKIIQYTVEKLLKIKIQQTNTVNKTRDRYEQDCLRIKGYLAQGHMVMGQEERKNKAKLEKTQISLATSNAEYEAAVKALEDTTARWNREWKAAADKFQDLEEERLDFTKSSLWTFANLASTVCVSDDASCEKIRLSLEKMDVENDILHFINERGTGQEIPDPPKYINFCRGDVDDHRSDVSDEENYSVAQFPRSINPAFRTSSPQPSTYESHHDPNSALARDLGHQEPVALPEPEPMASLPASHSQTLPLHNSHPQTLPLQNVHPHTLPPHTGHPQVMPLHNTHPQAMPPQISHPAAMAPQNGRPPVLPPQDPHPSQDRRAIHSMQQYDASQFSAVPHDPYPMDGMTMLCRTDGMNSGSNSNVPSRFDGMKSASTPNVSSRFNGSNSPTSSNVVSARYEAMNPASNSNNSARFDNRKSVTTPNVSSRSDGVNSSMNSAAGSNVSTRYEDLNLATNTNVSSRFNQKNYLPSSDVPARYEGLNTANNSNVSSRFDGMNSATSSNISTRYDAMNSANSSNISAPDDNSEYSNPTSFSSQEPPSGKVSPVKAEPIKVESPRVKPAKVEPVKVEPVKEEPIAVEPEKRVAKKKSGFFQNHSPFRRKSTKDVPASNRNTWGPVTPQAVSTPRRPQVYQLETQNMITERTATPDPIDANASLALNVGQNVFPVANTDKRNQSIDKGVPPAQEEMDPIALALAELKGAVEIKQPASRISADRYHGISTPVPDRPQDRSQNQIPDRTQERAQERTQDRTQSRAQSRVQDRTQDRAQSRAQSRAQDRSQDQTPLFSRPVPAPRVGSDAGTGLRGTPPPSYDTPVQRLGVPPPAVTSKAMQEASRKYTGQTRQMLSSSRPASVYNAAPSRPATRHADVPRAASPAPPRSASPLPTMQPETRQAPRSASPNPYSGSQHTHSPQPSMSKRGSDHGYYRQSSPNDVRSRAASPAPFAADYDRPISRSSAMAVQLAPVGGEGSIYGSVRSRGSGRPGTSSSSRAMSFYEGQDSTGQDSRQRSRSVADPSRQYTPEGRAILHYARALYMYQAAIPEELGFAKGDVLAVLRHQDDGWWEAEIHSGSGVGRGGLVPSNYLQPC